MAGFNQCGLRRISAQHLHAMKTLFDQCDLGDSQFLNGDFSAAQFIQSVMSDSDFSASNFKSASFYLSLMRKTQIGLCDLTDTNFLEADATLANAQNSNFNDAVNIAALIERRWQNAKRHAA